MRTRTARYAFNRGLVSRLGLARADIKRLSMAAEVHTNWIPRVLGSMSIRPGLEYLGAMKDNLFSFNIPFVFSVTEKAGIELTHYAMRIWLDDAVLTRPAVTTAVANGLFTSNLNSWTDNDESGGVSVWVTGGYMGLTGNGTAAAIRDQMVNTIEGGVEHALRIEIERGPVLVRVGTGAGTDEYVSETELATGTHSLAFTPIGNFNVRFFSRLKRQVLVASCTVESSGEMWMRAPWAADDLRKIRYDQSGDVVFVACYGYQQHRIERHATRSWSVVKYYANDGPFRVPNVSPITMTAAALSGNTTLTASAAYFKSTNVGSLFKLNSDGQTVTATVTAQNQFTSAIKVEGTGNQRVFTVTVDEDAAGAATFTLQRSLVGDSGPWTDVQQWTADVTTPYDDGLSNQITWYRLGVKTGDYVNGTHTVTLTYTVGSIAGVCRVTDYTSSTVVSVEVITDFGGTAAVDDWSEGSWSDRRGWPSAVTFHEGRLNWDGKDAIQLSISDAFDGFDPEYEGDAAPINRTIGSGPVDKVNWALSLQRLILGGEGAEFSVRSSSLDEPLTPTNFNIKRSSTQGSAPVQAVQVDQNGVFVQRGGIRVYEIGFGQTGVDYEATHLSALIPDIGSPGIVRMFVQRQPDTRIHFIRSDGTVAMLVFDKVEQVICWLEIETDGEIEDGYVLPSDSGDPEDFVYYVVKRNINGSEVRFLEKWAFQEDCLGHSDLCNLADSFVSYTGAATTTVTAAHLAGEQVVIWADGADVGTASDGTLTYTLDGAGQATLPTPVTNYVVGLRYTASWQSAKLVEIMENPAGSLNDHQQLKSLGLLLADVHAQGLKYGQSLTEADMNGLPLIEEGTTVDPDTVHTAYSSEPIVFPGVWTTDGRLCFLAKAPRPVTVLAGIAELEFHG